jgi:ATP-dependent DNA helicase RecQ
MLDNAPATTLRVDSSDVARRGALERRKLREMIEFCYTEACYRAHILDYFGDRHHARQCGTCGNCTPNSAARKPLTREETLPDLETPSRRRKSVAASREQITPRQLTAEEGICVRKILACATRMKGRFGKTILVNTLRGSIAKAVMQAHLNELSTYGILREMRQDDLLAYVDALVGARCLRLSAGTYPTVSITELGERVMREQERVELPLPVQS